MPRASISRRSEGSTALPAAKSIEIPARDSASARSSANIVMPLRVTGTVNTCSVFIGYSLASSADSFAAGAEVRSAS